MKCNKCNFNGNPNLEETGPHTKAVCPKCSAYIKMVGKRELDGIIVSSLPEAGGLNNNKTLMSQTRRCNMSNKSIIKTAIKYKDTTEMIKTAIVAGLKHIGGDGLLCKNCGNKSSAHKFTKGRSTMYGCNLCGARLGISNLTKQLETPLQTGLS